MNREFYWKDYGGECAVLYGPERHEIAAVIVLDHGKPETMDSCWRTISEHYRSLNHEEEDTGIPLGMMKRRILIMLGNELSRRQGELSEDMVSVAGLLEACPETHEVR